MEPFKYEGEKMIVDCYAVELYLPAEYADTAYRGTPYYALLGTKVKYLGVGNFRFFKSEAEMKDPLKVECYPYVVPMFITGEPSDIDVRDVQFTTKNKRMRKCIVLTFLKGDAFMCNTEIIKNTDALMMYLSRLEQGKLDHIPPEVAIQGLRDCESMCGVSLRIPSEDEELFCSMRYRDPDKPDRQYRYHTGSVHDPYDTVSYNMRVDAQQMSSFIGLMHEDVNNSLITAVNRDNRGETAEPNAFECIIRGLPLDDFIAADIPPETIIPAPDTSQIVEPDTLNREDHIDNITS